MKVLIVDDDIVHRTLMAEMLRRFGNVEIVEAADAATAWQWLEDGHRPVLCCCDMRMPGMSGVELLQRFRSLPALADAPFVLISSSDEGETVNTAIAAGATQYLVKPLTFNKIRQSLGALFNDIRARYSETPAATQKRLGTSPEKLLGYYTVFRQQIGDARGPLGDQIAAGTFSPVRARLESLAAACVTLGLWHAASCVEQLHDLDASRVDRVLGEIADCVAEQAAIAQNEFMPPASRQDIGWAA